MTRYFANPYAAPVNTMLEYTLTSVENGLIFQINGQSADISSFLANNSYRAKNGLLIAASEFPEFKDSKNTIFLRGSDSVKNTKLDVTRFVSNKVRDNKKEMIKDALKEFVAFVKKQRVPVYNYAPRYMAPAYNEDRVVAIVLS